MKKIILLFTLRQAQGITLCFLLLTLVVNAQTPPNAFNYSAVARNTAGQPIATTTIGIQITILKTSPTGASQYSENHFVNTDAYGLFNLVIGAGAVQSGSMATIDWSNDNYYLKVGMDAAGGTNFLTMGTTQLLSVPYAMYAKSAGSVSGGSGITITSVSTAGDTLYLSNGQTFTSSPNGSGMSSGIINSLDCLNATRYGILNNSIPSTGVYIKITYTGGAGGVYGSQSINSTGVLGLNAYLPSGTFGFGDDTLIFTITGTPTSSGTAYFGLNIGGQVCNFSFEVFQSIGGLYIGQNYQGGIIAYLFQPGDPGYDSNVPHGFIVAGSDQSSGIAWGCEGILIGTQSNIGSGISNTSLIVNTCSDLTFAAKLCSDLILNGYNDWYLPSLDECSLLLQNLHSYNLGGFTAGAYWTSTETGINNANWNTFGNGVYGPPKSFTGKVRAIRAF